MRNNMEGKNGMNKKIASNSLGLTKKEESKLAFAIAQVSDKLFTLDKREDSQSVIFSDLFTDTLREIDTTGIVTQIEDKLGRLLTYQDIAKISLTGDDFLATLDYAKIYDATGSSKFYSLARLYAQKASEVINCLGLSSEDKQEYDDMIQSYEGERSLQNVVVDYQKFLNGKNIYLPHYIYITTDDVYNFKEQNITQNTIAKDFVGLSISNQKAQEKNIQKQLNDIGRKANKPVRISDELRGIYNIFYNTLSPQEQKDVNLMGGFDPNIENNLIEKFLSYMKNKINIHDVGENKYRDFKEMYESLNDLYKNKNNIVKCSTNTQQRYLQKQHKYREKSEALASLGDFFHIMGLHKKDLEKLLDIIFTALKSNSGLQQKIIYDFDGKKIQQSFNVELLGERWMEAENPIEYWDRPLPIKIILEDGSILQTTGENKKTFQEIISWMICIASGNSLSKNEQQEFIQNFNEAIQPQKQNISKDFEKIFIKKVHSFSKEYILKNLEEVNDEIRLFEAGKILNRKFTEKQKKAILQAHNVGYYKNKEDAPKEKQESLVFVNQFGLWAECGSDRDEGNNKNRYARGWHYTQHQLALKLQALKDGGFSKEEIKDLMYAGIAGRVSRNDEILFTQEDIQNLENEIIQAVENIELIKKTGVIEGKSPVDIAAIKDEIISINTDLQQKEKDRANFAMEAENPKLTSTEQAGYKIEVQRLANEIQALQKRKNQLEEQYDPINSYISRKKREIDNLHNKLDEKKYNLKKLGKEQEIYENIPKERGIDNSIEEIDTINKQIKDINEEIQRENIRLRTDNNLTNQQKDALKRHIDDLEEEQKSLEKFKKDIDTNIPSEIIDKSQDSLEGLKVVWDSIKGEKTAEPILGTSLFLRAGIRDNYFPKEINAELGNWIEMRIKSVDKNTGKISFTMHGVFKELYSSDGKTKRENATVSLTPKELKEQVVQGMFDNVYKLKTLSNIKEWGMHIKNADIDFSGIPGGGDNKHQAWLNDMKSQMDFASFHKIKMENTEEKLEAGEKIKYFGGMSEIYDKGTLKYNKYRLWYKLEKADGDQVILKEIYKDENGKEDNGLTKKHSFTPQGFFFFAAENNLRPYTQGEVNEINRKSPNASNHHGELDYIDDATLSPHNQPAWIVRKYAEKRGFLGLKWGSIKSVLASIKKFNTEGIKKYLDGKNKNNEDLVRNSLMTGKFMSWLADAKIPAVSEIVASMNADLKDKLTQAKTDKIKKFKEEAANLGDGGPVSQQRAILNEFFNSPNTSYGVNEITSDRFLNAQQNPLKVAGYFLWCCENGGPYAKSLAAFDGTGSWIKLLLGEDFQKQYLKEREDMCKRIESLPHDSEERINLQDLYAKQDLGFLQKFGLDQAVDGTSPWKKIYGEAFFSKMLGAAEMSWNSQKAISATEADISDAKLFDGLLADFYAHITTGRGSSTAHLGKMAAKVQTNERYYYDWAGAMMFNILSGGLKQNFVEEGKQWYIGLTRKYAFVPGLYGQDGDGEKQLMRLIDIVAKRIGAIPLSTLQGKDKQTFAVGDMRTVPGTKNSKVAVNAGIMKDWIHRPESKRVIDALMSPEKLLNILEKERPTEGESSPSQGSLNNYNVVKDYLENKFMDSEMSSMGNTDNIRRSVIFSKHIWSFSPALVQKLMEAKNNYSTFPSSIADVGPLLWRKLGDGVDKMMKQGMTKEKFKFLLKRFIQYFDGKLLPEEQRMLIAGIRHRNLDAIKVAISGSFDKKTLGSNLHADVYRTLDLFERAFKEGGEKFEGDPAWLDVFIGEDSWSNVRKSYDSIDLIKLSEMVSKKKQKIKNPFLMAAEDSDLYDLYAP